MRLSVLPTLFLFLPLSLWSQNPARDALKIGYTQVYLSKDDAFRPGLFIEYTRVFYAPISIGVSGGFSTAKDLLTPQDSKDLFTFNVDLNFLYGLLENDLNELHLGIGLSARSFQYEGVFLPSEIAFKENSTRPGISAMINYQVILDPILIGIRGTVQGYSDRGAVYLFGGFVGLKF